eukprot:TRINITY_DN4448_c0_g1_i1.p1 TRINITY_DN4448_c0_g1~~TRINITY_DN4448_c0_g1_i1.p1  ORF type:complete len:153 (+),score=17.11 TRINITY_DN4448_c0_g1_i1:46-459(+)
MVENKDSCAAFVVTITPVFGISDVRIRIAGATHMIYSVNYMPDIVPLIICCSELVADGWDGSFEIEAEAIPLSSFSLSISIPSFTMTLPISQYFHAVPSHVDCNGTRVTCIDGCPTNVPATNDPLYSYWSRSMYVRC